MTVKILVGNTLDVLRSMPSESVHCCVTSPPYWGLRSYLPDGHHDKPLEIGLEPTPEAFVARMVEVFREVRRVLRKDGTCWVNLGDSYATLPAGKCSDPHKTSGLTSTQTQGVARDHKASWDSAKASGLRVKNLVGIPWRVAFALQADGWYLRSDIIWSKPNPMPESVTDRCTKSHEYIFMLTKAERYFYDAEAIKEPASYPDGPNAPGSIKSPYGQGFTRLARDVGVGANARPSKAVPNGVSGAGRNKRTVWEVATAPFAEAHFATFPPALIEPMIKAGTSEKGCCAKCGAPWERVQDVGESDYARLGKVTGSKLGKSDTDPRNQANGGGQTRTASGAVPSLKAAPRVTTGWAASCSCDAPVVPCTVLDVFGGAGTTGLVADRLQRSAVLIELNPEYAALAEKRIFNDAGGLFAAVGVDTPKPSKPQAQPSLLEDA